MPEYVIGVSMSSHDRSAALLRDGRLVSAVAEERLDRRKRSQGFYQSDSSGKVLPPVRAITTLVREHGLALDQISLVACGRSVTQCRDDLLEAMPFDPERVVEPPPPGHHVAHAYSAYATCPFTSTAVLVLDEQGYRTPDGRFERGTWFSGVDGTLSVERRFIGTDSDMSLGMFFDVFAALTGLSEAGLPAAGKLMALAGFGQEHEEWPSLVRTSMDGDVGVSISELDEFLEKVALVPVQPGYVGWTVRKIEDFRNKYNPVHWSTHLAGDLATFAQSELERGILHTARALQVHTGERYLSYAGGVALNCTANAKLRDSGFSDVFVHPAATDDGCAVGLAYYAWIERLGHRREPVPRASVYLGPLYRKADFQGALHRYGLEGYAVAATPALVAQSVADGNLVCRFAGRSEWGPRALGARSILADPQLEDVVRRVNSRVKFREPFRPFGVSVAAEAAEKLLELDDIPASLGPFMLAVARIRDHRLEGLAHSDRTVRYQLVDSAAPEYLAVLREFGERTGLPALLNTSFNTLGEPLVENPTDAVRQFLLCGADILVLEDVLVDITSLPNADRERAVATATHDTRTDALALALRHEAAGYPEVAERTLSGIPDPGYSHGTDYLRQYHALWMRLAVGQHESLALAHHAEQVLKLSGLPNAAVDAARLLHADSDALGILTPSAALVLLTIASQGGSLQVLQQLLPRQDDQAKGGAHA